LDGALGVRPEGLRVHALNDDVAPGVQGRVELIEALGADTLVHVDLGGLSVVARQPERVALAAGDAVRVTLDPAALHCFDRDGRALAPA
jgi:multiple sugar transport system ATP-binding protein